MTIQTKSILHQGILRLWQSSGLDNTGISVAWANTLRSSLHLLEAAQSLSEIVAPKYSTVIVRKARGRKYGYYIELNHRWRFTFDVVEPETGEASNLNIEAADPGKSS